MTITWIVVVLLLLLWIALNMFSPLSIVTRAKPMSIGRIPADILMRATTENVAYYTDDLLPRGWAYTVWLGNQYAVVIDQTFLKRAQPSQVRFVLAHELGHCALGHIRLRWLAVVSGLVLVPWVRTKLKDLETQADGYAEQLSGLPRTILTERDVEKIYALVDASNDAPIAPFKRK